MALSFLIGKSRHLLPFLGFDSWDLSPVGVLRVPEDSLYRNLLATLESMDQGGDEHEGERGFACPRFGERADDRGGGVLADVEVPDCGGHTEGSQIWGEQDCLRLVWNIDCL